MTIDYEWNNRDDKRDDDDMKLKHVFRAPVVAFLGIRKKKKITAFKFRHVVARTHQFVLKSI